MNSSVIGILNILQVFLGVFASPSPKNLLKKQAWTGGGDTGVRQEHVRQDVCGALEDVEQLAAHVKHDGTLPGGVGLPVTENQTPTIKMMMRMVTMTRVRK